MKLNEEFERYNMFRRPDWRIERVLKMLDRYPSPGRCTWRDDDVVKQTRKFISTWRACEDLEERKNKLFSQNKGLFFAFQLYENAEEEPEQLMYIQARLLAKQTPEEIAKVLHTQPETVEWYEKVFFNVCDRLESRDWVTKYVLMPSFMRNQVGASKSTLHDDAEPVNPFRDSTVAKPFLDATLKLFAYFGGQHVVDVLISGFQAGKPCASQEDLAQWFDTNWAATLRRRSHQASMQFEINKYNVMELFAVHSQIIQIEKSADNQESQRSATERHIKAMMDDIPWAVGEDGERMSAGTELGRFDEGAAELRDDEILLVSGNRTPKHLLDPDARLQALPPPRMKKPTLDKSGPSSLLPDDK